MKETGKYHLVFLIFFLMTGISDLYGQECSSVKLEIDQYEVSYKEYHDFLKENDPEYSHTGKEADRLFEAYHLKRYDAIQKGYDTVPGYLDNIQNLRLMLGAKHTNYNLVSDTLLMDYYRRTLYTVELSHIRIDIGGNIQYDTLAAYHLIDSIRSEANSEKAFKSLAYRYSDSRTSVDSGYIGTLTGMQAPFPLEEMAFSTEVGSISEIYRTSGAYHLVFVHAKTKIEEPESSFPEVKQQVLNYYSDAESRENYLRDKYLRKILSIYGFHFYSDAYEAFVRYGATSFVEGKWVRPQSMDEEKALFQIGNRSATYSHFSDYLSKQQFAYHIKNYPPVINSHFQEYMFEFCRNYDRDHIEQRSPEIRQALNLYSSGLLVQMIDNELSQQALQDKRGLEKQFRKNRENYKVQGYEGVIISFKDMQARRSLEFEIKNLDVDPESLAGIATKYDGIENAERVKVKRGENPVIDHFIWKQSPFQTGYSLIIVVGDYTMIQASNYAEALSDVVYDLTKKKEKEYLKKLRKQYTVRLY